MRWKEVKVVTLVAQEVKEVQGVKEADAEEGVVQAVLGRTARTHSGPLPRSGQSD
jgi:hypothetical protein